MTQSNDPKPGGQPLETTTSSPQGPSQAFLEIAREHPEWSSPEAMTNFRAEISSVVGTVSGLPKDMAQPLQPWPTWIGPAQQREFQRVSLALARLFRSVPQRVFDGDAAKIAEFLGMGDPLMVTLLLAEPNFLGQTICRGDFIETAEGLKLVEFNIGNLGGWQHSAFEALYLRQPWVCQFLDQTGRTAACRNSIRGLFRHVIGHTLTTPLGRESSINLLIVASDQGLSSVDSHPVRAYEQEFAHQLQSLAPGKAGRVRVGRVSDLEFSKGQLHAGGERVHAVVEQNDTRPSSAIFRCFKAGLVNCYTSPLGMILGDKKLLALLSSLQESDLFDPAEQQLLRDHLPWTRKISQEPLSFRGDAGPPLEVLRNHRTSLVLKAGAGYGGADVHIGPATSPEKWEEVTREAVRSSGWVAQEYLEGIPHSYPRGGDGAPVPYDVAWGLYVFGEEYGGTFLRMAPRGESPVLNIAQGAQIGVGLEVTEGK